MEHCDMKELALIITLITAGDKPDIQRMKPVASIEECWVSAKKFVEMTLDESMKKAGIIGLAAACAWREKEPDGDPT
jgi:hypothetical protein